MQTDTPKADPREVMREAFATTYSWAPFRADHMAEIAIEALTASGLSIVPVASGDVGDLVERLRNERPVSMLDVLALHLRAASALESLAARAEAAEAALSPAPAVDEKTEGEGR